MFWLLMRVDRSTWADCKYTQTICEISLDLYQCNVLKTSDMRKIIKYVLLIFGVKLYYFVFLKPFDHVSISFHIFLQKCNTYLNKLSQIGLASLKFFHRNCFSILWIAFNVGFACLVEWNLLFSYSKKTGHDDTQGTE